MLRCRSVHHTYVGEDRRILASPCTGLSTDRSLFFLCPLSAPLLFKQVLRSTSLAGLPFRLGLGRVMDAIGYSSGLLAPLHLVRSRTLYHFKVIWIFVYYICILDSLSRCCIYFCSVGPIEDCCVMLLLCFPPARKCLVGTFESFLCGFWRESLKLA